MSINLDWDHFSDIYGSYSNGAESKNPLRKRGNTPKDDKADCRQQVKFRGKSDVSNHPEVVLDLVYYDGTPAERTLYLDDYTELYNFLLKRNYIVGSYHKFYANRDSMLELIVKDGERHHYKMVVTITNVVANLVPELPSGLKSSPVLNDVRPARKTLKRKKKSVRISKPAKKGQRK